MLRVTDASRHLRGLTFMVRLQMNVFNVCCLICEM